MGLPIIFIAAVALTFATACSGDEPVQDDDAESGDDLSADDGEDESDDDDGEGKPAGSPAGSNDEPDTKEGNAKLDGGAKADDAPASGGSKKDGGGAVLRKDAGLPGPSADASAGPSAPAAPAGENCLKGSGDYTKNGPYKVKKRDVTIGSQGPYTLFYPDPLDSDCKHPIVAWGNGTGVTGSGTYAFYQEHAASWGIVVVAAHNSNTGTGAFHTAGLDYLLAQNKESGSEFFGKLAEVAGTSGHSQGGAGANAGAKHPSVRAIGNVQGAFGTAPSNAAFLCLTGTEDIATEGCKSAVNSARMPALYGNWDGGDHVGTATLAGFLGGDLGTKQYMRLYTSWFRCFLSNDQQACALFKGGADCPVCKEPGWAEIFTKNY